MEPNDDSAVKQLARFVLEHIKDTTPNQIIKNMKFYLQNNFTKPSRRAISACEYVFEHPEIHSRLKEITDGSYVNNQILLLDTYSTFTSLEDTRNFEELVTGQGFYNHKSDNEEVSIEELDEIAHYGGPIFVHFQTTVPYCSLWLP